MEDNSKSIERNLNKLFQKMVIEKYPEYFTQCDISVSYVEEDEDTAVPYYAIFLELEAKSIDGVEEFRRKVGVPLIRYFKGIVKYVQPHNFLFDYDLRF